MAAEDKVPAYAGSGAIKSLHKDERPREKLLRHGPSVLSDAELLAILINTGTSRHSALDLGRSLIEKSGHDLDELGRFTLEQMTELPGIGEAKAITLSAALELGRRRAAFQPQPKPKIGSSEDACRYARPFLTDLDHECFYLLLLKRNNEVIREPVLISRGGVSGTLVDAKLLFRHALERLASNVILFHNHPSGNRRPSQADIRLTEKLVSGGKVLDITVLDHIIVVAHDYYSFSDEGIMPT
jgi:DNA repair protein RadC